MHLTSPFVRIYPVTASSWQLMPFITILLLAGSVSLTKAQVVDKKDPAAVARFLTTKTTFRNSEKGVTLNFMEGTGSVNDYLNGNSHGGDFYMRHSSGTEVEGKWKVMRGDEGLYYVRCYDLKQGDRDSYRRSLPPIKFLVDHNGQYLMNGKSLHRFHVTH